MKHFPYEAVAERRKRVSRISQDQWLQHNIGGAHEKRISALDQRRRMPSRQVGCGGRFASRSCSRIAISTTRAWCSVSAGI